MAQKVCDKHDESFHPRFKQWADDYFVIKHRGERRGLGERSSMRHIPSTRNQ